jgi:class 3 adenylate cyclase
MVIIFGGILESGVTIAWGVLVVVGGTAIFADRRAHLWLVVFVVVTILGQGLTEIVEPLYALPDRDYFALFNVLVVSVFIYAVLYYFVRQSARLYQQSESLLHNILPDQVVARLKRGNRMIADDFSAASILFADVAGFTPMSSQLTPEQIVEMLNDVFTGFDGLVAECGLEKIKTIGDAYMVAAGVPVVRDDHAIAICDLALAMRDHVDASEFGGRRLKMRIGIASGPVMAGIIGTQKFSYDLWGDTVNVASRMESAGVPGRIQVTDDTRHLVEDQFECEERGMVAVKGKGQLRTWFLNGRR